MKKEIIKWGDGHILQCDICFQMVRRGYSLSEPDEEGKYWDDFFAHKLKPVKYRIFKGWGDKKEVKFIKP